MTRKALFDAVRPFIPAGRTFRDSEIQALDAIADGFGLPREDAWDSLPADYFSLLAKIESNNRPYIKAATSSGSGLYQFLRATWIGEGGRWGDNPAEAFGGLRQTAAEQTQRVRTLTAKNAAALRRAGVPINNASLYAAHFLGAGVAARMIAADVNARADRIAGEAATKANESILRGKTVGQFLSWLHGKTGAWAR